MESEPAESAGISSEESSDTKGEELNFRNISSTSSAASAAVTAAAEDVAGTKDGSEKEEEKVAGGGGDDGHQQETGQEKRHPAGGGGNAGGWKDGDSSQPNPKTRRTAASGAVKDGKSLANSSWNEPQQQKDKKTEENSSAKDSRDDSDKKDEKPEENNTNPPSIPYLPDEILTMIFSCCMPQEILTVLPLVDRRWKELARTKSAWPSKVTLKGSDPLVRRYLALGGSRFRRVELSGWMEVEKILSLVAETCPELEEISFHDDCKTVNPDQIGIEFPKVLSIDFRQSPSLVSLVSRLSLPDLRTLILPPVHRITREDLEKLLSGKPKLTTVDGGGTILRNEVDLIEVLAREVGPTLRELRGVIIGSETLDYLDDFPYAGLHLLQDMPNFQALSLSFKGSVHELRFRDTVVRPLFPVTHRMVSLELDFGKGPGVVPQWWLTQLFGRGMFSNLRNLKLQLSGRADEYLGYALVHELTKKLSGLESLAISSVGCLWTGHLLMTLAYNCPNLVSLDLDLGFYGGQFDVPATFFVSIGIWDNLKELRMELHSNYTALPGQGDPPVWKWTGNGAFIR